MDYIAIIQKCLITHLPHPAVTRSHCVNITAIGISRLVSCCEMLESLDLTSSILNYDDICM